MKTIAKVEEITETLANIHAELVNWPHPTTDFKNPEMLDHIRWIFSIVSGDLNGYSGSASGHPELVSIWEKMIVLKIRVGNMWRIATAGLNAKSLVSKVQDDLDEIISLFDHLEK